MWNKLLALDFSGSTARARLLLRLGLAFAFLYAGIASLREPFNWVGYLPSVLTSHVHATTVLKITAIYELLLAAWLLLGRYVRHAALLTALTLAGIIVANPHALDITFRDISLLVAALALFVL